MAITFVSIVRFAKNLPLPFSKKSISKEYNVGCSGGRPKGTGASDGYSVGHSGGALVVLEIGPRGLVPVIESILEGHWCQ